MSTRYNKETTASLRCIRKRPVSFGNPALGVYYGTVYTVDTNSQYMPPVIEGAQSVDCLVAMVDVPPDQVPEGILHLARPYRPWIDHMRIVIAEPNSPKLQNQEQEQQPHKQQKAFQNLNVESDYESFTNTPSLSSSINMSQTSFTLSPSLHVSAAESAASILAAEQEKDQLDEHQAQERHYNDDKSDRAYLVLIELCDQDAARQFVDDLNEKPYTSLDETQICHIYHVIALEGTDGVSLMSPFFAPTQVKTNTKSNYNTISNVGSNNNTIVAATTTTTTASNSNSIMTNKKGSKDEEDNNNNTMTALLQQQQTHIAESYNCAVCLEHMEFSDRQHGHNNNNSERTSILTTVCNHSFHLDCLLQWQDSPCPVCRYDHSGLNETLSQCHVCGTTEHNYVCLICGVVSCGVSSNAMGLPSEDDACQVDASANLLTNGNNSNMVSLTSCRSDDTTNTVGSSSLQARSLTASHARQHYDETLHAYALNTESQHVWDFAGQGYVHRLLQNKEDGKLVEVADPTNTTSHERSLSPGLSDAQEGEVVHRKLEGYASQYYTLLKSQLEQQRTYYEGRLEEIRREYNDVSSKRKSTDLIAALKQERNQLSQRLSTLKTRCVKAKSDVTFLKSMNESLEANKEPLRRQIIQVQQERVEARQYFDKSLPPLQEKVTRLMLQLESVALQDTDGAKQSSSRKK